MSLDETALNIGRQIVKHVVSVWLDVRREQAERGHTIRPSEFAGIEFLGAAPRRVGVMRLVRL